VWGSSSGSPQRKLLPSPVVSERLCSDDTVGKEVSLQQTTVDSNELAKFAEHPGGEPCLIARVVIPRIAVMPTSNSFLEFQKTDAVLNLQRRGSFVRR